MRLYMTGLIKLRKRQDAAGYLFQERRAFLYAYAYGRQGIALEAIQCSYLAAFPNAFGAGYWEGRGDAAS